MDWPGIAAGAVLAASAVVAYGRSFSVPLLFDDIPSIAGNATIRHLGTAFWAPIGTTAGGRPVLNLSLALDYAISGTAVWSYHATNLAIHILAGLTLFSILRRALPGRAAQPALLAAFSCALLWSLHPLQTESVTYIIQRAESLMGLFYLLTLYCFIRGAEAGGRRGAWWHGLSVLSCLLGMATKEAMVSAPLIVLLYDRTFLAGSLREAWRRRRPAYAGLAATWIILPILVVSTHGRNGSAGFGSGVPWWSYALTQATALVHYLRLALWPTGLVFDYGTALAPPSSGAAACALGVAGLLGATIWAIFRKPALGFAGAFFFAALAPSSSVVPVATETMAEHRMYLALIPIAAVVVAGLFRWLGRAALPACLVAAAVLAGATWERNGVYQSGEGIWGDAAAKRPGNARAHNNLGTALDKIPGRVDDAIAEYQQALSLSPDYSEAHYNLGHALTLRGRTPEAVAQYEEALRLNPDYAEAHYNLGLALERVPGRADGAIAEYEAALRLDPGLADAHFALASDLQALPGRLGEAIAQYREGLRLQPGYADAHYNLACALQADPGRYAEAAAQFEEAIRLKPDFPDACYNLGCILQTNPGRTDEAIARFREALRLRPDFPEAHYTLGSALLEKPGRLSEAIAEYEEALRLRPDFAEAHGNLGYALAKVPGRLNDAIAEYEEALSLKPDDASTHINLAIALLKVPGKAGQAAAHLREAMRLQPGNDMARQILAGTGPSQN
jgi:tetratricopeptide (TPR) repeat protein